MSVCTANCKGCFFHKILAALDAGYCDYICMTDRRRPCPAGDGCTEKVKADPFKPKAFTVIRRRDRLSEEEKKQRKREQYLKRYAARTEEDKARDREKCRNYYRAHKELCHEKHREYQQKNKDRINAQNRERRRRQREAKG